MEGRSPRGGRPRVPRKIGERSTLSLRIATALFEKLDAEATRKGLPLSNEAEARLAMTFNNEAELGGTKTAALLREFAAFALRYKDIGYEGEGTDGWLTDRDAFNEVTALWSRRLDELRDSLPTDDWSDLDEFRADLARADENSKRALRRYAKKLSQITALDPEIRNEYARLAKGETGQ